MPTDFKPEYTYLGRVQDRRGEGCRIIKNNNVSGSADIQFEDGRMFYRVPRRKLCPIPQIHGLTPEKTFRPTHVYVGHRKGKHDMECTLRKSENKNPDAVFEDGEVLVNVKSDYTKPIRLDAVGTLWPPDKESDRNFKPDHYHSGGIDTWAFSEANMSTDKVIGFHLINVLKYVSRHEKKNGLEDLKKAQDSLKEAIRLYEARTEIDDNQ